MDARDYSISSLAIKKRGKKIALWEISRTFAAHIPLCVPASPLTNAETEGLEKREKELKNITTQMIIVPVKEGENIERVLKRFKRKASKTGIIKEVRRRREFTKPSVERRVKMQHAIYVNKLHLEEEQ